MIMLVTGSTGGIGKVIAASARDNGWKIVGTGTDDGDLADPMVAERIVSSCGSELRAVVHCVGGIRAGKQISRTPTDDIELMIRLNIMTTFNVLRAAMPRLEANGGGSFIAFGAQSLAHPVPDRAAYTMSKAAVASLIASAAEEGRPVGIRANCILPSIVRTEANLAWSDGTADKQWITPEEIASTVLALSAPECGVSGAMIPMFGKVPF
jgi:NAD(P)-dependent dehydrogenase (short-subunit alcohol dehydrogenase family)